jgi:hypothetical protein
VGEIKLKGVEQPIAAYTIIDPIGPAVAGA